MRLPPALALTIRHRPPLRTVVAGLAEVWLVVLGVQVLEMIGRHTRDDAGDVVGVLVLLLMISLLGGAARAAHAPLTRLVAGRAGDTLRRLLGRLEPVAGVAFRLPDDPRPVPWSPRRGTLASLAVLLILAAAFGDRLPSGLVWLRTHVAYAAYLLALLVLWSLFGVVTALGLVALRAAARIDAESRRRALDLAPWIALWVAALASLAFLPGWVPLAAFAVLALVQSVPALRGPPRPYWLWRKDAQGRVRTTTVPAWLRSTWLATILSLGLVVVLAQLPRLEVAVTPVGRFGITVGLGLAATVGALFLLVQGGRFLARAIPPTSRAPETPLVRSLWWPGGEEGASWLQALQGQGWRASTSARAPATGYDLVVGAVADPRRCEPPDDLALEDAVFRVERRFHVVKRRAFYRGLRRLHKEVTRPPRVPGMGYLFCPHAWPVPSLIRDGAPSADDGRAVLGGTHVGPPYAQVFSLRVRRYLAEVLGALEIDLIYWEDRLAWAPLRAALGVLFETYEQGRRPAEERHFIGLTRVRVLIQEPEDADEILADPLRHAEDGPPPLRARVLVLRKDDGGARDEVPDRQPGSRLPVGVA